jgi:hypothetical protein
MNNVGEDQLDRGGDMSTPDARLSAAERAALADLEASAAAADPSLAGRLGGGSAWRARTWLQVLASRSKALWGRTLNLRWWGIGVAVVGLFLVVLGLSSGLALSVLGVVMAAVGLRIVAQIFVSRPD